jgi:hypothetical protein
LNDLHYLLEEETGVTFKDELIGSMSRKFVLVEKGTKNFDFDYNLIIQDDAGYTNATDLHQAFENSLVDIREEYNRRHSRNPMRVTKSKTVFTISFRDRSSQYNCDLAIIDEGYDDDDELCQYVVMYNEHQHNYVYNERRHVNFVDDIDYINYEGYNEDLREQYLILKNKNRNPNKKSFELFSEAINNVLNHMYQDGIDY